MYKAAGMQWQKASKTHTFLDLHPRCLKGRFEANHKVQSTVLEYHFQKRSLFFREKSRKSIKKLHGGSCKLVFLPNLNQGVDP